MDREGEGVGTGLREEAGGAKRGRRREDGRREDKKGGGEESYSSQQPTRSRPLLDRRDSSFQGVAALVWGSQKNRVLP